MVIWYRSRCWSLYLLDDDNDDDDDGDHDGDDDDDKRVMISSTIMIPC